MKTTPVKRRASKLAGVAMGAGILMVAAAPVMAAEESGKQGFLEKVERWQDKMSDTFRDTWRNLRTESGGKASGISASVDLREQDGSYIVRLNLPDRDLDKVEIKLDAGTLRIVAPAGKAGHYEQSVILAGVAPGAEPRIERKNEDDLIVVTVPKKSAAAGTAASPERADRLLSPLSTWESDVMRRMEKMNREMDRIFEESFGEFRSWPEHTGRFDRRSFGSFVDLKEEGADYIVTAYLPERDIKDVNVAVEDQTLRIEAKAETTAGPDKEDENLSATRMASYSQLLTLPGPVQAHEMKVDRKEGVLTVKLPKAK